MAFIYARLISQNKVKYHTLFSASFHKIIEEDRRGEEIEIFNNLNIHHNLTETDNFDIDVKSKLEHQIQIQETKKSGWIFEKTNSMKQNFIKLVKKMVRIMLKVHWHQML